MNIDIRLVGGNNELNEYEGRVEVLHQGEWGTVCDDHFDMNDAHVVCRMMGMGRALSYCSKGGNQSCLFAAGSGKVWLDNLRCSGYESSLFDCTHAGVGQENCYPREDIGVVCESKRIHITKFMCIRIRI